MAKIRLDSNFTFKKILQISLGPIMMMIFTSIYVAIDGLFVSNVAGSESFAGMNLIAPVIMIVGGLGFMFGSGGSALVSKFLGEKEHDKANKAFTMMIEASFILVLILSVVLFFFIDDLVIMLAKLSKDSTQRMIDEGIMYGRILVLGQPLFAVQSLFQSFFVVDERPEQGFIQTLISGISNIILDAFFICGCRLGVSGAAIGTIIGYFIGGAYSILYFVFKKDNLLKIKPTWFNFKYLLKASTNGASDFIFSIASSVISFVFNIQLLKYIGQDGVNAFGVIMYVSFVFSAIYIGIAIGTAPIISFNLGAKNDSELKNIVKKTIILVACISVVLVGLCEILARPFAMLFCDTEELISLSTKSLRCYAVAFLFSGVCIFITSMFTALNNGFISGLMSLLRTFVFEIGLLFLLPLIMGVDGLWWTIPISEFLSIISCLISFFAYRKKYHY